MPVRTALSTAALKNVLTLTVGKPRGPLTCHSPKPPAQPATILHGLKDLQALLHAHSTERTGVHPEAKDSLRRQPPLRWRCLGSYLAARSQAYRGHSHPNIPAVRHA